MKISITLPTLYPTLAMKSIEAIRANTLSHSYEIIVVSPKQIEGEDIVWIPEQEPKGNCAAHKLASRHVTGEMIVAMTDDFLVPQFWDEISVDFVKRMESIYPNRPISVGLGCHRHLGTVFGKYYPYFPMMRVSTLEKIGGWFTEDLSAHFGDADMALRVWESKGICALCPGVELEPVRPRNSAESPNKSKNKQKDLANFCQKWKSTYADGWKTDYLRDFNLDIPYHLLRHLPKWLYRNGEDIVSIDSEGVKLREILLECINEHEDKAFQYSYFNGWYGRKKPILKLERKVISFLGKFLTFARK